MTVTTFELRDRFAADRGDIAIGGMHAIVRTIIDQRRADRSAGLRTAGLISGYPGSPVGGLDAVIGQQRAILDELDVAFVPGLNEELGATAVWGSRRQRHRHPQYTASRLWYAGHRARPARRDPRGNWVGWGFVEPSRGRGRSAEQASALPSRRSSTRPTSSCRCYPGSVAEVIALGRYAYSFRGTAAVALKIGTDWPTYQPCQTFGRHSSARVHWRDARERPALTFPAGAHDPSDRYPTVASRRRRFGRVNESTASVDPAARPCCSYTRSASYYSSSTL